MPLNADYLLNRPFPPIETPVTDLTAMLYALSIGLGRDPMDEHDLRYVYEKDLKIFPTMPVIIGHPGNWMIDPEASITRTMVVHGAQRLHTHKPLPVGGTVVATNRITACLDKGDKGAVIVSERLVHDKATGDLLATMASNAFCRADGHFGGDRGEATAFQPTPDRAPDHVVAMPTEPNAALIYRLNHDRNPLHADPAVAARAKFDRPILHGLCTYGVAAVAVARQWQDRTLTGFECRFSRPVFPGETITVDIWDEGDGDIAFRARVADREAVVLDSGRARLA